MSTCKHHFALLVALVASVALLPPLASGMVVINKGGDLQQFTAGQHVLGFQSDSMYTVGSHYMLKVNFAGAAAVTPVSNGTSENHGKTPALAKVTYDNLCRASAWFMKTPPTALSKAPIKFLIYSEFSITTVISYQIFQEYKANLVQDSCKATLHSSFLLDLCKATWNEFK